MQAFSYLITPEGNYKFYSYVWDCSQKKVIQGDN